MGDRCRIKSISHIWDNRWSDEGCVKRESRAVPRPGWRFEPRVCFGPRRRACVSLILMIHKTAGPVNTFLNISAKNVLASGSLRKRQSLPLAILGPRYDRGSVRSSTSPHEDLMKTRTLSHEFC